LPFGKGTGTLVYVLSKVFARLHVDVCFLKVLAGMHVDLFFLKVLAGMRVDVFILKVLAGMHVVLLQPNAVLSNVLVVIQLESDPVRKFPESGSGPLLFRHKTLCSRVRRLWQSTHNSRC
jgi:hypothetical protein